MSYQIREFNLSGLKGISDATLEMHFGLYGGYVKNTNLLNEQLAEIQTKGIDDSRIAYSEIKRRLGFEYNGMVLHEYYFENMKNDGGGDPGDGVFLAAAEESFGSYQRWREDFGQVGTLRGIGWAICFLDPGSGLVSNHWVAEHEIGNVAGFRPVLVMDVWEHAYLLDFKPTERGKYIEAFFVNLDWGIVERRMG